MDTAQHRIGTPVYPLVGVIAKLVLGQLAVLWPALRAALMPPAVVTRSI